MSTIETVCRRLDRDGFYPALQTLDNVEGIDRERRLLAVAYARRVQHLMTDPESIAALDAEERYANGEAKKDDLPAAGDASWTAQMANAWLTREAWRGGVGVFEADYASKAEREWQIAELRRVCECIEAGTDPYPYPRGES